MMAKSRSSHKKTASPNAGLIAESVAVVIVNYRTPDLTAACLAALEWERSAFRTLRIMVVDGGSADGSAEKLSEWIARHGLGDSAQLLALPVNGGFGWANNQAIQRLMSLGEPPEYIHLLNPDTEVEPRAVSLLAEYLSRHPRAAAVGSQLLEPDGSWTGSAFSFPSIRGEFSRGARTAAVDRLLRVPPVSVRTTTAREVDWATGASVMFRAEALRDVGLFDEGFFLYHEEIELMWRMRRAGWTIATEPRSRVRHVGGGATGVHSRETSGTVEPRRPRYWYRSRTRYFGLTRGRAAAALAFTSWLLGHGVWRIRRRAGFAAGAKRFDHELRDHLTNAFPRSHDFAPATVPANSAPSDHPAWMKNRWL